MQLSSVERWADGYLEEMRHFSSLIQRLMVMQWARGAGHTAPKPQSSWFWTVDITIQLLLLLFTHLLTLNAKQQ